MSKTVDYDGTLLRIKFRASGSTFTELKEMIKTLPGREWHASEGVWTAHPGKKAVELLYYSYFDFTPGASFLITADMKRMRNALAEEPMEVLVNKKLKGLRPYQVDGVHFIIKKHGRALIGDEMGLGKTIQAIGYCKLNPENRPVLVICPASVKLNWEREIYKWTGETSIIISGRKPQPLKRSKWYIANFDILATQEVDAQGKKKLTGWIKEFEKISLTTIIVDECQKIVNEKTIWTKAVKYLVKRLKTELIALSGTPIKNRPSEFYTILDLLNPNLFKSRWDYNFRYCDPKHNGFGWTFKGATNIEELNEIVSTVMIRRLKKDHLPELPPKQRSVVPMELNSKQLKEYEQASADFMDWLGNNQTAGIQSEGLIEAMKQAAYVAKRNAVMSWLSDFLETGEKLIVFAWHVKVIEDLMTQFKDIAVKIDGSVSAEKRQAAIDRFQTDPNCQLFVGQIIAAGSGITLTASSSVAFVELGWTPGDHEQAEDRIHRIGQTADSVNIYYLIAQGTVEDDIMELLEEKYVALKHVLDGDANGVLFGDSAKSIQNELIQKIRRKLAQ